MWDGGGPAKKNRYHIASSSQKGDAARLQLTLRTQEECRKGRILLWGGGVNSVAYVSKIFLEANFVRRAEAAGGGDTSQTRIDTYSAGWREEI